MYAYRLQQGWAPPAQQAGAFLPQVRLSGAPRTAAVPRIGRPAGQFAMATRMSHPAHPTMGYQQSVRRLGQTAQEWYDKAKAALARFDFLKGQIASIDNSSARSSIITWLGAANVPGTPEYRYARVKDDFTNDVAVAGIQGTYGGIADSDSPMYEKYSPRDAERRQGRILELEDWNEQFEDKIQAAQATHGTRPVPTTPGAPTPTKPPEGPDLTVPVLVGAGAIALAIVLGGGA